MNLRLEWDKIGMLEHWKTGILGVELMLAEKWELI